MKYFLEVNEKNYIEPKAEPSPINIPKILPNCSDAVTLFVAFTITAASFFDQFIITKDVNSG